MITTIISINPESKRFPSKCFKCWKHWYCIQNRFIAILTGFLLLNTESTLIYIYTGNMAYLKYYYLEVITTAFLEYSSSVTAWGANKLNLDSEVQAECWRAALVLISHFMYFSAVKRIHLIITVHHQTCWSTSRTPAAEQVGISFPNLGLSSL